MEFYHDSRNVDDYIHMAKGYDGRLLIEQLASYIKEGASILELGMGPGKDMEILKEKYKVTGTDESEIFVDRYKIRNKEADVFRLDAVKMDVDRSFDCIYSNKVLMHLNTSDMIKSLRKQVEHLNENGVLFHSLWKGTGEEEFDGLRFVYYKEDEIRSILEQEFNILDVCTYTEAEENDSLYIVIKK